MRENATESYVQGREKVRGAAYDFEKYVQAQAVKSALIATGVGLVGAFGGTADRFPQSQECLQKPGHVKLTEFQPDRE